MADPKQPSKRNAKAEDAEEPKVDAKEAVAESEAEQADEAQAEQPKADKDPKPKRRGAAETSTKAKARTITVPTNAEGVVEVRASARFVRNPPRKARLVMDHVRGKSVGEARTILRHNPRGAAVDILKLLESAIANAENNFELDPDDLRIHRATVDEGPTIKRFRPRAHGRATPIHKRTSHMAITLTTTAGKPSAGKAGRS